MRFPCSGVLRSERNSNLTLQSAIYLAHVLASRITKFGLQFFCKGRTDASSVVFDHHASLGSSSASPARFRNLLFVGLALREDVSHFLCRLLHSNSCPLQLYLESFHRITFKTWFLMQNHFFQYQSMHGSMQWREVHSCVQSMQDPNPSISFRANFKLLLRTVHLRMD